MKVAEALVGGDLDKLNPNDVQKIFADAGLYSPQLLKPKSKEEAPEVIWS